MLLVVRLLLIFVQSGTVFIACVIRWLHLLCRGTFSVLHALRVCSVVFLLAHATIATFSPLDTTLTFVDFDFSSHQFLHGVALLTKLDLNSCINVGVGCLHSHSTCILLVRHGLVATIDGL